MRFTNVVSSLRSGWRGILLVAVTYIYFLIFAQFAFLKRLADLGIADAHLKLAMAAMACGGIAMSLLAPVPTRHVSPAWRLRAAFLLCACAAVLTLLQLSLLACVLVSLLIGCGLGLLTVTLVTHLRQWLGAGESLLQVGLGTGIGYFFCNFPPFFTASPQVQAVVAAGLCAGGIFAAGGAGNAGQAAGIIEFPLPSSRREEAEPSFVRVLFCFTALVWFDSAAFFIIQNTPALKAGTWQGDVHLWVNAALHLVAAVASAWLLRRRGLSAVLTTAFLFLASACLLLQSGGIVIASVLYPVGVSLYSVALVAYPAVLAPMASIASRGRMAGWIYAVAGWIGSAMGIGMAQNLGHVPVLFVAVAGVVILAPLLFSLLRHRRLEVAATCAVLLAAYGLQQVLHPRQLSDNRVFTQAQRGRQVYIAEGCIHCHSQYVRPGSRDEAMWGPVQSVEALRSLQPPLIGNRRQGPDLSEVGSRRSPLWLKAHQQQPAQLSPGSFMPPYAYLFGSGRGDDLVAYLAGLSGGDVAGHRAAESQWHLAPTAVAQADVTGGAQLFQQYCATCHASNGATRLQLHAEFHRLPPVFPAGPWRYLPSDAGGAVWNDTLARIIRFGIPGTDMPGHEYLPDYQIASIRAWLTQRVVHPGNDSNFPVQSSAMLNPTFGEKK